MDITKKFLIERLLKEGKITQDDAIVLRREEQPEVVYLTPPQPNPLLKPLPVIQPQPYKAKDWISEELERRAGIAERCACNPANGGSGVCGCVLTGPIVTC